MSTAAAGKVRLQSFLSDAGVASRRHAEELILEGKVLVNGRHIERLPVFVDPKRDEIVVNGARVRPQAHEYCLVHKPKGVVCTDQDPEGRPRAIDLLPPGRVRLFVVGRLDANATGLLLMTNDGELAARVMHPRYGIPKVYWVEVRGEVPEDLPARLQRGVYLEDGRASVSEAVILHRGRDASVLRVVLREPRNREIRRVLARLGCKVRKLRRTQIGPLLLKGLARGASRRLLPAELTALREAVAGTGPADGGAAGRRLRIAAASDRHRKAERRGRTQRRGQSAEPMPRRARGARRRAVARSARQRVRRRVRNGESSNSPGYRRSARTGERAGSPYHKENPRCGLEAHITGWKAR